MKRYLILKNYLDDEMDLREGRTYRFFKNYETVTSLMKLQRLVDTGFLHPLDPASKPPFFINHVKI